MRLILALLLTATPAVAGDKPNLDPAAPAIPGAVSLYLQAHALYAFGQAAQDPLTVLTAARLLRGLTLSDTARAPDPAPKSTTPLAPLDPQALITTAQTLDAGQNYSDLIDQIAHETPPQPKALRATAATLAPGASEVWTLTFFGGDYAELAILGDGKSNLDLLVTDAKDNQICLDKGSADAALCGFTPRENGDFKVTVTNSGATPDIYTLLTN